MFSGGIPVAPARTQLPSRQTASVRAVLSLLMHIHTGQHFLQLICALFYLTLLRPRKFVLPFHSHFLDEASPERRGDGPKFTAHLRWPRGLGAGCLTRCPCPSQGCTGDKNEDA